MKWWELKVSCTKCKGEAELKQLFYAADGQLQVLCACHNCKQMVKYMPYGTYLSAIAMRNDLQDQDKKLEEVKQLIAPPNINAADLEIFKQMHIDPDGDTRPQ